MSWELQLAKLRILSDTYDCRYGGQSPWIDSPHYEVIVHFIDFSRGFEVVHRADLRDTSLISPFDYEPSTVNNDDHIFEQHLYDLTNVNETRSFIRFRTLNSQGQSTPYVIDKGKSLLIYDEDIPQNILELGRSAGVTRSWLKEHWSASFERDCRIL